MVAGVLVAVVTAGCSGNSFDRERAIGDAIRESGDRMTREQAECYVDRVRSELGTAVLQPGATVPMEKRSRLVDIRVDCVGVENLGAMTTTSATGLPQVDSTILERGPQSFGDDPQLDALYTACSEGWGKACDELYDLAPMDSEYESFAASCGNRTYEIKCYDVYPSPGNTLPSDAQVTTTVAPPPP